MTKIMADDSKVGGSGAGVCPYCNNTYSNVSYHTSNHCRKNPNLAKYFKHLDEELYRKIMGKPKEKVEEAEVPIKNMTLESEHYIVVENAFENHSVEFKGTRVKIAEGIPFASQATNLMRQLEWGIVRPKDVVVFRSNEMDDYVRKEK